MDQAFVSDSQNVPFMTFETKMEELINFTRLTRKKEAPDCPIAKKREKTLKKRKVRRNDQLNVKDQS